MSARHIWETLDSAFSKEHLSAFSNFLNDNRTPGWIIASDYVVGDRNRPYDNACFTVLPIQERNPLRLWSDIPALIPRDLKKTTQVDERIITCLRDPRKFSLCGVLPKSRNLLRGVEHARQIIDAILVDRI
jgi:hypothetical protein